MAEADQEYSSPFEPGFNFGNYSYFNKKKAVEKIFFCHRPSH